MDWIGKDKKTGEIVTIFSHSYSGRGQEFTFSGKDGSFRTLSADEFWKIYDPVDYDLSFLFPILNAAAAELTEFRHILLPIARRFYPGGYYHVGDLVYVTNVPFDSNVPTWLGGNRSYVKGPDWNDIPSTFRIIKIGTDLSPTSTLLHGKIEEDPEVEILHLLPGNGPLPEKEEINKLIKSGSSQVVRAPMWKTRMFVKDACYYLKRYDQIY